jgi:choline dehydrogenase-like flavoprotein
VNTTFAPGSPSVLADIPDVVDCDFCIIGSGMGGATLALALRDSGAKVLVLEQGDFLPIELQNWDVKAIHLEGRYKNSEPWVNAMGHEYVPATYHYVGGATKFYGATLPRFREFDFGDVEHPDGVSPAWPLSYSELEPYYERAEKIFWVHGTQGEDPTEAWRSSDYPFPSVPHESTVEEFAASARAQGLRPFHLPLGIDYRDGGKCLRCGFCDATPCMVQAKGDAEFSAMRPALESPSVKLMTRAQVLSLRTDQSGRRVVEAAVRRDGRTISVRASRFVVAAGAVNTAALLLRSRSDDHPNGLANASGQVGRNFMLHTTSFFVAIDPRRRNRAIHQKTLGINDWYEPGPTNRYPLGNVQGLGKIYGATIKGARKWVPLTVLDKVAQRTLDLFVQTEDLPLRENSISIDGKGRVVVRRRATNLSSHRELVSRLTGVVKAAGYPIVVHEELGSEATAHQCGTACMGDSGANSVVNRDGQAHDVDNLSIVDASVFPSSAAVNPALTVAAFALRAAESESFLH